MLIMAAHEMLNIGSTVGDTSPSQMEDDSYSAQYLVDGDPHTPIRTAAGTFSFGVTGTGALSGINGLVVGYHDLIEGVTVNFSGLGDVETLAVPPNEIRLNPYTVMVTPSGSVTSTTVSLSGSPDNGAFCTVGEVFIGIFRTVRTLPVGTGFRMTGFGIQHPGEFRGMAYSKGGEAREFGGGVYMRDASKQILDDAWRASRENSLPTVIVPDAGWPDALVVTWERYEPVAVHQNLWQVQVMWLEVPRLRWPA